jgi:hypothetical protein
MSFTLAQQNVFTRRLCLEHDEKLVSYLSLLRDIEMRTKQIQPLELNVAELQDLLGQAKVSTPTFLHAHWLPDGGQVQGLQGPAFHYLH